jgi:MGT family glycosyltransferase
MITAKPANFLFTTFDGGGNVTPILSTVSTLLARGHAVRVMSDECTRHEIEASGARFVPWLRAPNKPQRSRELDPPDWTMSQKDGLQLMSEHFMGGLADAYAQDTVAELRREPADVVVNFDMLFGVMAACEARRQKLALLSTCISLFPLEGIPPFGSAAAPARTPAEVSSLRETALELAVIFDAGLPALNAARANLGLPPLAHLLDQAEAAQLRCIGTARAFDFPIRELPDSARYVGPLLKDPIWAAEWVSPWTPGDPRPLVVAGFSTSFQNHAGCLQRVIDACTALPVRLLLTLGGSIRRHEVVASANTVVVDSAPHGIVMREAAVVVTHGGHGTLMTALALGVPVLVLPHGRDQGDNAARVEWHGAGLALNNGAAASEIGDALKALLEVESYRRASQRLGAAIREEIHDSPLVAELERLAAHY